MAHQGIFKIDRADPFAAGFHEVLGAVDNFDEAFVVQGGDVAGLEPAVLGPAMGLGGRIVVLGGNPRAAYFEFAGSSAVARRFHISLAAGPTDAPLDNMPDPTVFRPPLVHL